MAVTFDAVGPSSAGASAAGAASLTWAHTCDASATAIVAGCAVGMGTDTGRSTTATYAGQTMTPGAIVHSGASTAGFLRAFTRISPATGANNVVVTLDSSTADLNGGSISAIGVGSFQTQYSNTGQNATPTATSVGSSADGLIAAFCALGSSISAATSPSTSRFIRNLNSTTAAGNCAGATSPSTGSNVTTAWSPSEWFAVIGVELLAGTPPPPPVYPDIPTTAGSTILTSNQATATTTHTFPNLASLPNTPGALLLAVIVTYSATTTNAEFSGWGGGMTEAADRASNATLPAIGVAYKLNASGSESGTFTVTTATSVRSAMFLMEITGAHATTPPEVSARATGTTAAADPAALDPAGWASEDTLWIAVGANGETSLTGSFTGITAAPASYTGLAEVQAVGGDVIGAIEGAVAFRQLTASSEDAGAFTLDVGAASNAALLIAVRPAPAFTVVDAGTGSVAGTGTIAAAGTVIPVGVGSVTATATIAGTGLRLGLATGSLSATATVAAAAVKVQPATGSLAATATLAATGTVVAAGAVVQATGSLTGTGTVAAAALVVSQATGSLSATATLAGSGLRLAQATGSLAATATLAADGTVIGQAPVVAATGSLAATASLAAAAVLVQPATGSLAATATLAGAGLRLAQATGSLTGTGTVAAAALVVSQATGSITATATISATGVLAGKVLADGAVTATGTLAASGLRLTDGAGSLTATATIAANAVLAGKVLADGTITATGTLAASGLRLAQGAGTITATGTLAASAVLVQRATGSLSATATISAAGVLVQRATGQLQATATIAATGTTFAIVQAAGSVQATATIGADGIIPAPGIPGGGWVSVGQPAGHVTEHTPVGQARAGSTGRVIEQDPGGLAHAGQPAGHVTEGTP